MLAAEPSWEPTAARPLLERALCINEAAYGPDHPAVATTLGSLAVVLCDLGEPASARPLQERALHIHEMAYGPDHPAVATSLGRLAVVLCDLGEPASARPLLERALHIDETASERTTQLPPTYGRHCDSSATYSNEKSSMLYRTPRLGKKKAIVALEHSMLTAVWHMLTHDVDYHDLGGDYFTRRDPERAMQRMIRQANALGFTVRLDPIQAA